MLRITVLLIVAGVQFAAGPAAWAQKPGAAPESRQRTSDQPVPPASRKIDLEILIQSQPTYRIKAQEWGRILQPLGYAPRFRQPRPGEAIRVENIDVAGAPEVRVVAGMGPDGSLKIRDQKFSMTDTVALKRSLDELAAWGAAGPPDRDPRWGMSDEQMEQITKILNEPVGAESVTLESAVVSLNRIGLPDSVTLDFSEDARESALGPAPEHAPKTLELSGFSKGTAFAIVLSQYGLGFRPAPLASGKYRLEICQGGEGSNLWPVGWKSKELVSSLIPAYLKSIPVTNVKETAVRDVISAVADWLRIPYFDSTHALATAGRSLDALKYSRADGKLTPGALLSSVGDKLEIGFEIRCDEAGKLFLWVTTPEEVKAFRTRFAHIRQN